MSGMTKSFGRLNINRCVFVLVDVQERFRNIIHCMDHVIQSSRFMVEASRILGVPCIVTEQYPKGLLHTVKEIDTQGIKTFEKSKFAITTPEVLEYVTSINGEPKNQAVIFGIEAHVCVQQTALDLLERGWDVHLVADAVSSSKPIHRNIALERMRAAGAFITTSESVVFELMKDKDHPKFKEISNLIKDQNAVLGKLSASL